MGWDAVPSKAHGDSSYQWKRRTKTLLYITWYMWIGHIRVKAEWQWWQWQWLFYWTSLCAKCFIYFIFFNQCKTPWGWYHYCTQFTGEKVKYLTFVSKEKSGESELQRVIFFSNAGYGDSLCNAPLALIQFNSIFDSRASLKHCADIGLGTEYREM